MQNASDNTEAFFVCTEWGKHMTALLIEQNEIQALNEHFETAHPQKILKWAAETYGDNLVIVTSFQPTGVATAHMMQDIAPDATFITLDTGLLFAETHKLIHQLEDRLDIRVKRVRPEQTLKQQAQTHGDNLWETNPDYCCTLRKVRPLENVLTNYDAWITGLRRDQSSSRANTPIISWDSRHGLVKLCPFATWTESMIWTYITAHELPYNELHNQNYPSIGCLTCTNAVTNGSDMRAGRWVNHGKTECGIHGAEAKLA